MVDVKRDIDLVAVPRQGFIDRVVDDLVDEVVQAGSAGRADVHRGTLADRLEAFENLDLVRAVVVRRACAVAVRTGTRVVGGSHAIGRWAPATLPATGPPLRYEVRFETFSDGFYRLSASCRVAPHSGTCTRSRQAFDRVRRSCQTLIGMMT